MTNSAPPKLWVALFPVVLTRTKTGSSRLMISARRCLRNTRKSARSREVNTSRSDGAGFALELVTNLAPGESDEHVLQRHLTASDLLDPRIVPVLLDQVMRRLGRQERAVIDNRDPIADRLRLLHRVRRQQDAS